MYVYCDGKISQLLNHRVWNNNIVICVITSHSRRIIELPNDLCSCFKGKIDFEYFNNLMKTSNIVFIAQLLQMLSPLVLIMRTRLHLDLKPNQLVRKEYG